MFTFFVPAANAGTAIAAATARAANRASSLRIDGLLGSGTGPPLPDAAAAPSLPGGDLVGHPHRVRLVRRVVGRVEDRLVASGLRRRPVPPAAGERRLVPAH